MKTFFDFILTSIGTIIISPLLIYLAYRINKEDPGPIIFKHTRIGKNGKPFSCYKFRTMVVDADKKLAKILSENEELRTEFEKTRKLQKDPRVTKIGEILRKTSLDEFPNFINVLKGEMSLVGPRAVIDGEIELFGEHKDEVLSVKPGITGYWAVNGRSDTTYEERVEMESYYVRNMSFVLDAKIICKTVVSVLRKKGAV